MKSKTAREIQAWVKLGRRPPGSAPLFERLPAVPAPRWQPLRVGGELQESARLSTAARTGVYAIREHAGGAVLYVGESHTASEDYPYRMWKTILRHLHGQASFRAVGEWAYSGSKDLDVAFWFVASGVALDAESAWIARLKPLHTKER